MRAHILATARDLQAHPDPPSPDAVLDEIAACAGITRRQLQAYYTSVDAIDIDTLPPASPPRPVAPTRTS